MNRYSRAIFRSLLGCIVLSSLPLASQAAVYYVDRNHALANDGNPGTSTLPFATINKGAQVAVAGDHVVVRTGTYPEVVRLPRSGQPGKPIVFSANGGVVVRPAKRAYWTGAFDIVGETDIVIEGFRIENSYMGINVGATKAGLRSGRIVVRNNYIYITESAGIRVADSDYVTVDSNVVEKGVWGGVAENITISGATNFLVNNNEVFRGPWTMNGRTVESKEGINIKEGSKNGRVTNNEVHDLERLGIYVDGWDTGVSNVEISGNTVYRCRYGIAIASERGGLVKNILISNNITHSNREFGIVVAKWVNNGRREDIRIVQNTVYGNVVGGINIGTTNLYRLFLHNNISAGNVGVQISADNVGLITDSKANLIYGAKTGNVAFGVKYGDPRFVDPRNANFRLGTGSAAANAGIAITDVKKDIAGVTRPQSVVYDIGAHESR